MTKNLFVSDLHGRISWYEKLFSTIESEKPAVVLLGGDLFPHPLRESAEYPNFISDFLRPNFLDLKQSLGDNYPCIMLIMGNDDYRSFETDLITAGKNRLWEYIHFKKISAYNHIIAGYSYVPPTPFQLKDWERYDVSRYVDPGCVSPEEGLHSTETEVQERRYSTIQKDLETLFGEEDLKNTICLFHSPPYKTKLDRADLDGKMIDHVPLDVHVGSIAIQRFIKQRQPKITLHGHIHESSRLTGEWQDRIGDTYAFSAAYEGPELSIIKFDPNYPEQAVRLLL
jgi:Icc-related predicted phosphoesterase